MPPLPHLETQEQVDALLPGTRFIWADDGDEYIKQNTEESRPASATPSLSEDFRDLIRAQGSHRFKRSFNEQMGRQTASAFSILLFFGVIALTFLLFMHWARVI